jgi:hypothetical protein
MSDVELSKEVYGLVRKPAELKVFLAEHPEVNLDLYKKGGCYTSLHCASSGVYHQCTETVTMLLDNKADQRENKKPQ